MIIWSSTTEKVLEVPKQDRTQSRLTYLSQQIADSAKGCPKRTELMYGNTTAAHGERRVHRTSLALIQGGCERNVHPFVGAERFVQYRQALPKRQHLQIIHIGMYELTERFVRAGAGVTKRDGISITKGCPKT